MKKHPSVTRAALIGLLTIGTVSWAQDPYSPTRPGQTNQPGQTDRNQEKNRYQTQTSQRAQTYHASQPQKVNKASSLIGMKVKNAAGEQLGTIKDLVLDFDSGKVAYCVLAADAGVLKPDRLHAVPLDAFQQSADGNSVTLNADKTKLAQAEGMERDAWPNVQNPSWGAEPFWEKPNEAGTIETGKPYRTDDQSKPYQKPAQDRTTPDQDQPK